MITKRQGSNMQTINAKYMAVVFLLLWGQFASAQQVVKATIEAKVDGLQAIQIPQEFRRWIGNDVAPLRIHNAQGNEIGFVWKPDIRETTTFQTVPFHKMVTDSTDAFVIHNPKKERKQGYIFRIANSAGSKDYVIEGSDDQETWFGLMNNGKFTQVYSEDHTSVVKNVSFPLTDYRYIRVTLDNKNSAPVQVLGIGEQVTHEIAQRYEPIQHVLCERKEDGKNKKTILTIRKNGRSPIDYIQFHITAPERYHRQATLYTTHTETHKRQTHTYDQPMTYMTLSDQQANEVTVENLSEDTFCILIENEDNVPLTIDSLSFFQKPITILADLKQGETYVLDADSSRMLPNYDLGRATIDFTTNFPRATLKGIEKVAPPPTNGRQHDIGRLMLFLGSVIGVLAIFYFGASLLRDMKKKSKLP
ncbi:hypothetical protein [Sphingobacterium haloxyli]|uniref:F5/8 type C domain-containing protein n=1 Tax=Sphingobacterium haloxyli TaxID=2100533 RepID=A0A2S9J7U1_9SPHI|nr:hypothetical protein [Sphingobacterium haloxyli]PRD48841.1 hypothetical protein C5745_02550 [Sphingobacterium haloxyli]